LEQLNGFRDRELSMSVAVLRELADRVYDQIQDLPQEAVDFCPENTGLSIAWLALHMAWTEAFSVSQITGAPIPEQLKEKLEPGKLEHYFEPPDSFGTAEQLITLCRQVQEQFSVPALKQVENIDSAVDIGETEATVRGVLNHLAWHWAYNSGQVGLLRLLWGSQYTSR